MAVRVGRAFFGVVVVGGSRLIAVRVGAVEIEAEAVLAAGTEPTSGRVPRVAGSVTDAFGRAQETIIEVARSTAEMIGRAGAAARPDRVEVEFGLKFSASGGVILAGVAGEASLKVTLSYDVAARTAGGPPAGPDGEAEEPGGPGEEPAVAGDGPQGLAGSS